MWLLKGIRENLIEILLGNENKYQNRIINTNSFPAEPIKGDNLYLIWDKEPNNKNILPNIISVADGRIRDFLAWAVTYFPNYLPFSAYFRVLEFNRLKSLEQRFEYPCLNGVEGACLGLIIGEILLLSLTSNRKPTINPMMCHTTISYALSRALALGVDPEEFSFIVEQWNLARKLTDQPFREIDLNEIITIFQIISHLRADNIKSNKNISNKSVPDSVISACLQIKEQGIISNELWRQMTDDNQGLQNALISMEGTREERVRFFQDIFSSIKINSNSEITQKFIFGYIGSLIGQGTLSHFDLVSRYADKFPTALLWYGLCAGLYKKNDLSNAFNVLGRRLLRDLLRNESIFDAPLSDVSIEELKIFLDGEHQKTDFRTFSQNRIYTELYPGISTYLTWPKQEAAKQMQLFETPANEPLLQKKRLSELGSLLHRAVDIYMDLSSEKDSVNESQQKSKTMKKKKTSGKKSVKDK